MTNIWTNNNDGSGVGDRPTTAMPSNAPIPDLESTKVHQPATENRQLIDFATTLHNPDSKTATNDLKPERLTGITGIYQGETHDPEMIFTLAHNLDFQAPPAEGLAKTIISHETILRENLMMLDKGFKAFAESENFFTPEDLNLKDKPEFKDYTASNDLSEFSPYFPDETSVFSKKFDEQLKKVSENAKENINFDFERNPILQLTQAISKSLDGDDKNLLVPLFKGIFSSNKSQEQTIDIAKNLLTKRLKAKLAIAARDFTKELSADEQSIFLLHSLIDAPQKQIDELYKVIFDKALEKIEPDAKYLDPNFFEGKYKEGLRRAIELELGANKEDLKTSEISFENSNHPDDVTLKNTMAKRLNALNPVPQVLADITIETPSGKLLSSLSRRVSNFRPGSIADINNEYQTKIVKPLADMLRRYNPRLDSYHPNIKNSVAEIYLDSVEALAAAKALQIFKAGKETALEDREFFKAIIKKDSDAIVLSLKKHFGDEHIANPLRRFFILSRIAGDSDFTRRIDLAKLERSRDFRRQPIVKWGLPTAAVSLLGGAVALATAGYQDSRDPYLKGKEISGFVDTGKPIDEVEINTSKAQLLEADQWANRDIYSLNNLLEAYKSNILIKNPKAFLFAKLVAETPEMKTSIARNPLIINLDIKKSPDGKLDLKALTQQLLQQLESKTKLLKNLNNTEEKEKFALEIIEKYNSVFNSFLAIKQPATTFLIPLTINSTSEATEPIEIAFLNNFHLDLLTQDLEPEDPDIRKDQLSKLSSAISAAGISLSFQDLVHDSQSKTIDGSSQTITSESYNEAAKVFAVNINRAGYIIDGFRKDLGKEALH